MKAKIIGMLIMTLLITTSTITISGDHTSNLEINNEATTMVSPTLDQYMDIVNTASMNNFYSYTDWLQGGEWQMFTPTGDFLSRIELYMGCWMETPPDSYPCTVTIERPLGNVIGSATKYSKGFPLNSEDWVTFWYNISVVPNEQHYINISFDPGIEYSWNGTIYEYEYYGHYNYGPYIFGWSNIFEPGFLTTQFDYAFKTYGEIPCKEAYVYYNMDYDIDDMLNPAYNSAIPPAQDEYATNYFAGINGYVDVRGITGWGAQGDEYLIFTVGPPYNGSHYAYVIRVVTAGNPEDHPESNGQSIKPRNFEYVIPASKHGTPIYMGDYASGHDNSFYIDDTGVYYGASNNEHFNSPGAGPGWGQGIKHWDFSNFVPGNAGTIFLSESCIGGQDITRNPVTEKWFIGVSNSNDYTSDRRIRYYQFNPIEFWKEQTSYPRIGCLTSDHHDGLEICGNYMYVTDSIDDRIARYELSSDGNPLQTSLEYFSFWTDNPNIAPYPRYIEGMGYGPNNHIWVTGHRHNPGGGHIGAIYEIGGNDLIATPQLSCLGNLQWTDVKPGSTVKGTFTVKNTGDPGSLLNWAVDNNPPSWGEWTFSPSYYNNLRPTDDPVTVDVTLVAPNQQEQIYDGTITIFGNSNDDSISVSLATPRTRDINIFQLLFQRLIERYPSLSFLLWV